MDIQRWLLITGVTLAIIFFLIVVGLAAWIGLSKRAEARQASRPEAGKSLMEDRASGAF